MPYICSVPYNTIGVIYRTMTTELIQSSIYLTKDQREFVRTNYINLSKVCRASVDNLIKKSEGQTLREQPTDKSGEDSNNG